MDKLKRIYRNALFSFKGLYGFLSPKIYILVKVVNPIFQVLCFSLIAKHAYGSDDITPYIVGNAFVLCTYSAFFGISETFITERSFGTLKLIIGAPCSKFTFFTSKSAFYILDGIVTIFIGLLTGIIFFNLKIPLSVIPEFLLCLLAAIFTACAMSLLIGSIGLLTRDINMLLNVSSMLLMALSGVNFPTSKLPFALQKLSSLLPLTNSLKGAKLLLGSGYISSDVYLFIFKEFLLGILYCLLGYIVFKIMERCCRTKATIDMY